jgi:hypothetical protein
MEAVLRDIIPYDALAIGADFTSTDTLRIQGAVEASIVVVHIPAQDGEVSISVPLQKKRLVSGKSAVERYAVKQLERWLSRAGPCTQTAQAGSRARSTVHR